MRKTTIKVGLFLCALAFLTTSLSPAASASDKPSTDKSLSGVSAFSYESEPIIKQKTAKKTATKPLIISADETPAQHTVMEGESLTTIATQHTSTWMRLFAKNTHITDPNTIAVGEVITIPLASEQLPERSLPASPSPVSAPSGQANNNSAPAAQGDTAGNTYYAGYCTWYAKNRRPDLPNSLGNADTWVSRAQAIGIPTGSAPRVGAIGQQGMHVVYVESVNPDGTVTISEMNYQGLYITSSRTVAAGNFIYIY